MKYLHKIRTQVMPLELEVFLTPYKQFIKFAIAGGVCMILELFTLFMLVEMYGMEYIYAFNIFAFTLAVSLNYVISRMWVFETGKHSKRFEALAFFATAFIGLGLNYWIFKIAIENLPFHYLIAKMLAIVCVMSWNFVTKKYFVFKG
jgi:putative flippase GtrA